MGHYFGTDGFRGEANLSLTTDHAFRIGRYLGHLFSQDHPARIVIGKDTRRSSYMLEYALVAGLTASGADAYLLHVTTTPSVAYVVRTEGFDGGVMISASHNPFYDNGIKLISSLGEKMSEEITDEMIGETIDAEYASDFTVAKMFSNEWWFRETNISEYGALLLKVKMARRYPENSRECLPRRSLRTANGA